MSTIGPDTDDAVAAAVAAVSRIDLSPINQKLQHENPALWTDETVADAEADYRRFLALTLLHPTESLVVNKIVDEYWHQHILDTRKYADDCEKVFGFFLHHFPYFGMRGEEDRRQHIEAFAVTQLYWEQAFGVPLTGESKLTLDKVLGSYQPEPKGIAKQRVYAFPQTCKCGQHCDKTVIPARRPQINS